MSTSGQRGQRSLGRPGRLSGFAASTGKALQRRSETPLEGLAEGWAPGVRLVVEAAVGLDLSLQTGSQVLAVLPGGSWSGDC